VIKDGPIYKMWYTGYDGSEGRIGYATSTNGVLWMKHLYNPVLNVGPSGSWDDEDVRHPWVIKEDSAFKMWYIGRDAAGHSRVGLATSIDGVLWTKIGLSPVLSEGASGQPDSRGIHRVCVIKDGFGYTMWYEARGEDGRSKICMAYSGDGGRWSKYDGNLDEVTDVILNILDRV